jgi:hypothetical protein
MHIVLLGTQGAITFHASTSKTISINPNTDHQVTHDGSGSRMRCTTINKSSSYPGWYGPAELTRLGRLGLEVVEAARDIFDEDNVRFNGGGVPDVFLDAGGQATADKLEQLLNWDSTQAA